MTISPQTPDIALPIAAFIRRHYPLARHWPREILLAWTRWHLGEGFLGHVLDGDQPGTGRIVGVGVCRPVMKPEDGLRDYCHDPEGSILFVDMVAATAPNAMLCLVSLMRQRFGFRQAIAYQRRGREKVVVRPFFAVHRRIFSPARVERLANSIQ